MARIRCLNLADFLVSSFGCTWKLAGRTTGDIAVYSLDPVELIAGTLPRRQRRFVEAWAELHQAELLADWQRLQGGQTPMPIDPLE